MRFFIVVAFAGTLFSCSTPIVLPRDYSEGKRILLPFRVDSIVFVDLRKDTLTYDMKLPVFAARQREWTVRPGLDKATKDEIIKQIKDASYPEGIPTLVTFYVHEGYYKITGNATKVGEHTRFDCEILFEPNDSYTKYSFEALAFYDYEGQFNATEKEVKAVYKITVRNSVFNGLTSAEKTFE